MLLDVGQHLNGPVDFDARDQIAAQLLDAIGQLFSPSNDIQATAVLAAELMHAEIGTRRH